MAGPRAYDPTGDSPMKAREMEAPEERLTQLQAELSSEASMLEAQARDLEDHMLILRARAAGLRTGAMGVEAAISRFRQEMESRATFMEKRDARDREPAENTGTWHGKTHAEYDASGHANRLP